MRESEKEVNNFLKNFVKAAGPIVSSLIEVGEQKLEETREHNLKQAPPEDLDNDVNYWKKGFEEMCKECKALHIKLVEKDKKLKILKDKLDEEIDYAWKLRRKLEWLSDQFENINFSQVFVEVDDFLKENKPPVWKRAKENYEKKVVNKNNTDKKTRWNEGDEWEEFEKTEKFNEWWRLFEKKARKKHKEQISKKNFDTIIKEVAEEYDVEKELEYIEKGFNKLKNLEEL